MEPRASDSLMFLMFENKLNNCWLDSSLAVIAHSKAIKQIADKYSPNSKINEIILKYNEATFVLNDLSNSIDYRMKTARELLVKVQTSILQYLQPILKYNDGEPDSAFCALLNLIYESKAIKEHLSIKWVWEKKCESCGISSKSSEILKPIITLSKVNTFEPYCPSSIFVCACKAEQEMKLIYKELPTCLIFHFEKGAGSGSGPPLFFTIQDRKYHLTGIVTLEKSQDPSVNHFITWIRDPLTNKWLECNDLNLEIILFSSEQPQFVLRDIYMYIYESFDKRGKISNEVSNDSFSEQNLQNVEVIDLSDDSEIKDDKSESSVLITSDNMKHIETSVANLLLKDSADVVSTIEPKPLNADESKPDKSNFEVPIKRKLSEQHLFENSVEESPDVKDEQNIMPPPKVPKVITQPKVVEEETDYDEDELQKRMQRALLKKDYSRCANVNKSVNDGSISNVHESKTIVEKSSINKLEKHHKRMNEMQTNDSVSCTISAKDNNIAGNQNLVPKTSVEESSKNKSEKYHKRIGEMQAIDSNASGSSIPKTVMLDLLISNKLTKDKNVVGNQSHVPKTDVQKAVKSEKHHKRVSERLLNDSVDCTTSAKDNNMAENQNHAPKTSVEESSKNKSEKYHKRMSEMQTIDSNSTDSRIPKTVMLDLLISNKLMKDKNAAGNQSHVPKTDAEKSVKSEKHHKRVSERQSNDSIDCTTSMKDKKEKHHKRVSERQSNDSTDCTTSTKGKKEKHHKRVNERQSNDFIDCTTSTKDKKEKHHKKVSEKQSNDSVDCTTSTKAKYIAGNQSNVPVIINVEKPSEKCHKRMSEKQAYDTVGHIIPAEEKNVAGNQNPLSETSVEKSSGKKSENYKRIIEGQTNGSMGSTALSKNKSVARKQRKADNKPEQSDRNREIIVVLNNVVESTVAAFLDSVKKRELK